MMKQSRKYAPDPETLALRAELQAAQSELALAYRQFDQATAPLPRPGVITTSGC